MRPPRSTGPFLGPSGRVSSQQVLEHAPELKRAGEGVLLPVDGAHGAVEAVIVPAGDVDVKVDCHGRHRSDPVAQG